MHCSKAKLQKIDPNLDKTWIDVMGSSRLDSHVLDLLSYNYLEYVFEATGRRWRRNATFGFQRMINNNQQILN